MSLRLQSHGLSDVGLVRTNNEDAWLSSPEDQLFLLADGLGGHQAGEVAAREAIEFFNATYCEWKKRREGEALTEHDVVLELRTCFEKTNDHLFDLACSHELLRGMGTTFCALSFYDEMVAVSHVGDSRVYRLRSNVLEQITRDHCWTKGLLFSPPVGFGFSKGVLTRALGTMPKVEPTIRLLTVQHKDSFLLCSDGLSDMVSHAQIEDILRRSLTIGERVRMLVSTAKNNGGGDNITVILVEVVNGIS